MPRFGYNADGIILRDSAFSDLWENKTPGAGKTHGAATICDKCKKCMVNSRLKIKHDDYGQVQLGMLLTCMRTCDFTLYCDGLDEIFVDKVTFNETFTKDMVVALTEVFYFSRFCHG